jgi:hypothetical protein
MGYLRDAHLDYVLGFESSFIVLFARVVQKVECSLGMGEAVSSILTLGTISWIVIRFAIDPVWKTGGSLTLVEVGFLCYPPIWPLAHTGTVRKVVALVGRKSLASSILVGQPISWT